MRLRSMAVLMLAGWMVVTYRGVPVAGPFTFLQDCTRLAEQLAQQNSQVSRTCQPDRR